MHKLLASIIHLSTRKSLIIAMGLYLLVGGLYLQYGPWVIANHQNPKVKIAAFGYQFDQKPFTGLLYKQYSNNQLKRLTFVLNGKLHFWDIQWYSHGQKLSQRRFHHGQEQGEQKYWHPQGEPGGYSFYDKGQRQGESWSWYPNGEVRSFKKYIDGKEFVIRDYTHTSRPFHNYVRTSQGLAGFKGAKNCDPTRYNKN